MNFLAVALWLAMQQGSKIQPNKVDFKGGELCVVVDGQCLTNDELIRNREWEPDRCYITTPDGVTRPCFYESINDGPVTPTKEPKWSDLTAPSGPVTYTFKGSDNKTHTLIEAAEPMDVPAIEETREIEAESGANFELCNVCDKARCKLEDCTHQTHKYQVKMETCSDRSRILLTAEDGTKHCIKFPK